MAITRRDFLKSTAVAGAALYLGIFNFEPVKAYADANPPVWTSEAISVCGYCSVGCSMIVGKTTNLPGYTGEYVTYVQGNPDSPINGGTLCSKGSASAQFSTVVDTSGARQPNQGRLTVPLKRAGNSSVWTEITWATAISEIAAKVQATRNAAFLATDGGITVNRCPNIATLGGSSLNNEAAYLICKLNRALGVVNMETQARN